MRIHYSYLDEWVGISGFEIHKRENFVNIKYKLPSSLFYNIGAGHYNFVLKIIFGIHGLKYSFFQKEIFIVQKTYIEIESYTSDHFWDYAKIKYNIENFLNLSIVRPVYPLSIIGTTKDKQNKEVFIEIYYRLPDSPKVFKPLIPYEMLFTFTDIKDKFDKFLENWFNVYNKLEPVYSLYSEILYNPYINIENRFLNIIQALETFHRRVYGGAYLSEEEYKPIYDALINAIPKHVDSNLRERLKAYLKYGREFSLRRRIKDIVKNYPFISKVINDGFINKVVNTRNYYVHYDESLKESSTDRKDLYYITQKLKMLLDICLLGILGFSVEEIRLLILRNEKYKRLINSSYP